MLCKQIDTVWLSFQLKENLEEIEVVNKVNPYLDREALRILNRMPKWIPAVQDGDRVDRVQTIENGKAI